MKSCTRVALATGILIGWATDASHGQVVDYAIQIEATIDSGSAFNLGPGDGTVGELRFVSPPDSNTVDPTLGIYNAAGDDCMYHGLQTDFWVVITPATIAINDGSVGGGADTMCITSDPSPATDIDGNLLGVVTVEFLLTNFGGGLFSDDSLPESVSLADFDVATVLISEAGPGPALLGTITSFSANVTCPWDCANSNGEIGIEEFLAVLGQWGTEDTCDFDGGGVGINDFLKVLGLWGPCP